MMPHFAAVYHSFGQLHKALNILESNGYDNSTVQVTHAIDHRMELYPNDYDPLGGVRFSGTTMGTMAATGPNLVGNSVTVDVRLDMLPDLLAALAEDAESTVREKASYLLTLTTDDPERLERLLAGAGGERVQIRG